MDYECDCRLLFMENVSCNPKYQIIYLNTLHHKIANKRGGREVITLTLKRNVVPSLPFPFPNAEIRVNEGDRGRD